jgi:DNA-binding NtrC family response regulator
MNDPGMNPIPRILVVDDQEPVRRGLRRVLSGSGYEVETVGDAESAIDRVIEFSPDLVILDLNLPGMGGLEFVAALQERGIEATIVVLTGHASIDSAVEATRRGVFDYLEKPVNPEKLRAVVARAVERSNLRREVTLLRRELMRSGKLERLVGRAPSMHELYQLLDQIAPTEATVLITGESGTGKEVIARTIHRLSPRSPRPFVPVNVAAIPETLLESEIFGHEKGAFTGATGSRAGCFEQADGGTLFLDEIGEMPLDLQTKLLRVLEDHRVRRLGGQREVEVNVRVIAATNADVARLLEEGRFRKDLYFRLNVFTLDIPPLRERREDIPLLAEHFLEEHRSENRTKITGFSREALALLERQPWPGNVRELKNAIHRAAILCPEGEIQPQHLPMALHGGRVPGQDRGSPGNVTLPVGTSVAEAERALIEETLRTCRGNKSKAARILGISLKTLYTRLKKYGVGKDESGEPAAGERSAGASPGKARARGAGHSSPGSSDRPGAPDRPDLPRGSPDPPDSESK